MRLCCLEKEPQPRLLWSRLDLTMYGRFVVVFHVQFLRRPFHRWQLGSLQWDCSCLRLMRRFRCECPERGPMRMAHPRLLLPTCGTMLEWHAGVWLSTLKEKMPLGV